ncbi:MAG TPA: hypothetical protein VEI28_05690 [Thermodesulfovibrionales bacterium]|nr:hypothetical protein [Thermodesulfovibrionales bacterium]
MFKFITRLILLAIIIFIVFIVLSVHSGGEKFRWFGKKVEQESQRVGEKADQLKKGGETVIKGIEKTTEKVKEFTGSKNKDEKSR